MEVSETLKKAWAAVEDAGLPEKIHEAAFKEAVRLLASVPIIAGAAPLNAASAARPATQAGKSGSQSGSTSASGSGGEGANGDGGKVTATEDELFEKVEQQTGVSKQHLSEIVHLDDGVLRVSIPGIKLGKNNAEKTRAIAQIFTIVRGFGLDEAETSLELVRAEAQRLKCYDQANFSSQVKVLNGYLITGTGMNRRIRAKSGGIEAFAALVENLLGAS
ncbi:hypothetical protein [[Mycobacterium] crassicus]|uniref:Uncharacterized protein n=1 Tax=[Mycobacterium] crassicus TaxID=2872309 RepID=A0ABU5XQL3_9MYCO|nr:hypothetical protein [Mycolicibacter sp. MYC098]MEB3023612.1 hypothetical protein [Mycolicibacter sp. MYC098]